MRYTFVARVTTEKAPGLAPVERLFHRYSSDVYGLARQKLGSSADAEDVAQTTFLNAHRALIRGTRPVNERAWLLAITRNVCHQRFRALEHRPREEPLDESRHPAADRDDRDEHELVDALKTLPRRQREAIVLREVYGCTTAEIGERLGLGPSAVDALIFRARTALRDELHASEAHVECSSIDALVGRQLTHELDDGEQTTLRAHLRTCDPCASRARSLRARKRATALLALPWELLSRLTGHGGFAVKTASVLALATGATAVQPDVPTPAGPSETPLTRRSSAAPPTAITVRPRFVLAREVTTSPPPPMHPARSLPARPSTAAPAAALQRPPRVAPEPTAAATTTATSRPELTVTPTTTAEQDTSLPPATVARPEAVTHSSLPTRPAGFPECRSREISWPTSISPTWRHPNRRQFPAATSSCPAPRHQRCRSSPRRQQSASRPSSSRREDRGHVALESLGTVAP